MPEPEKKPVALSRTDPVVRFLSHRWGGPAGNHLEYDDRKRFWTLPRVLTLLTLIGVLLAFLSKSYCRLYGWSEPSMFFAGCYSDVAVLWDSRDFAISAWAPFDPNLTAFEYPALSSIYASVIASATVGISEIFQGTSLAYWGERESLLFWDLTFATAAIGWLVLTLTTMYAAGRRPWDAAIVAISPAIILGIGINWDIWPAAMLMLAILASMRRRWILTGVFIGLGTALKLYPLFLLGALVTLAIRSAVRKEQPADGITLPTFGIVTGSAVLTWLAVNVPVMLIHFEAWSTFFTFSSERGAGFSSIWHIWNVATGWELSPDIVSVAWISVFALSCLAIFIIGIRAPQRPRLAQLVFLIVAAFVLASKVYSPQFMIWLVPLIVLAAPRVRDVVIWHVAQVLHFGAIWFYLGAVNSDWGSQRTFDTSLYVLAVVFHMVVTLYICYQVVKDMFNPERDVVRHPPDLTPQPEAVSR